MEHDIAMAMRSIESGLDGMENHIPNLSNMDVDNLHLARYRIEQLLMKVQYPILRRANG